MLGTETDVFLIDTQADRVYNLGEGVGTDAVERMMRKICGPHDVRYFSERFIVISGIEWGVESFNPKTLKVRSIYNTKVIKSGRRFSSQY
jgi:hypothetical protein